MAARKWFRITALAAVCMVVLAMVLGSCGDKGKNGGDWTIDRVAGLFAGGFSAEADIVLGELAMSGELTREGSRTALSLTSPEHLEGLTFAIDGRNIDVSYKGLSVKGDSLPTAGLGKAIGQAMDALTHPELLTVGISEEGEPTASGRTECGPFTLRLGEEGPIALEIPELQLSCAFRAFQPAGETETSTPDTSASEPSSAPSSEPSAPESSDSSLSDLSSSLLEPSGEDVSSLQQGAA